MITIKLIKENEVLKPERSLTDEEKATVTSALYNGVDAIFYQGDEPVSENEIIEEINPE
jgi:hypothetical protein